MSTFEVKVQQIFIKCHSGADALELGNIGSPDGWQVVVKKDQYQTGDLVTYIGENAVVPQWILKKYRFWNDEKRVGMLAGKAGNRVKMVRLRGETSLGICLPLVKEGISFFLETENGFVEVVEGQDVSILLGIEKYVPVVPVHMEGEVTNIHGKTLRYDIENIKKWHDILIDGEEVVFTEKLHGTFCFFGYYPKLNHPELLNGNIFTASKGLGAQGLVFKNNERNKDNIYVHALENTRDQPNNWTLVERVISSVGTDGKNFPYLTSDTPFYILGEIYGKGIQDLTYGAMKPEFRVFDVYVGKPNHSEGRFLNFDQKKHFCLSFDIKMVPTLYRGPFSKAKMQEMTRGRETVSGKQLNIREGIVITPTVERYTENLGRVILKSVSEDYLLRKGNNVTEFE